MKKKKKVKVSKVSKKYINADEKKRIRRPSIIPLVFIILVATGYVIWKNNRDDIQVTEAVYGKHEIYKETKAYILNDEEVVDYTKEETLIPIAESEKRTPIGSIIAMYKNTQYDNDLKELQKIDNEINEKLTTLPEVYSTEIIQIDKEIDQIAKQIKQTTSYIEMRDYKTRIDDLTHKKTLKMSSLSPSGSEIKNLMTKREEYKDNMNKSSNNVKAPVSGVVIYENDGLENKFDIKDITKITVNEIQEIIKSYNEINSSSFGLKIVDNYTSYVIIPIEDKTNDGYIIEGNNYTIELLDRGTKIKGLLIDRIESGEESYCIFKITNNIEEIVNLRKTNVKVIWKEVNGFVVDNNSMKTIDDIDYVTVLSLNKYIDVPVKVLIKLDNKSLVKNYTTEEREQLSITETRQLNLYDRIIVNSEN